MAEYEVVGYLCQNDETGGGPSVEHRRAAWGHWTRNLLMREPKCAECWPVFRLKAAQVTLPTDNCPRCHLRPTWVDDDLCEGCAEAVADAWLTGATPDRPEGRTTDPRTGLLWDERRAG